MIKRAFIIVQGRVQGVGFRYFVNRAAINYDIKGYVKNLPNGDVEIDAEGEEYKLNLFINECKKGPSYANIVHCHITFPAPAHYLNFTIK